MIQSRFLRARFVHLLGGEKRLVEQSLKFLVPVSTKIVFAKQRNEIRSYLNAVIDTTKGGNSGSVN